MANIKYTPPEWLEDEAKAYIAEVLKALNKAKNLQNIDLAAINMLAISYSTYIQASHQVAEEGITIVNFKHEPVKHPAVNIAKDALSQTMRIITEYGLTLKSREAMSATKPTDEKGSPLEDFWKVSKKGAKK